MAALHEIEITGTATATLIDGFAHLGPNIHCGINLSAPNLTAFLGQGTSYIRQTLATDVNGDKEMPPHSADIWSESEDPGTGRYLVGGTITLTLSAKVDRRPNLRFIDTNEWACTPSDGLPWPPNNPRQVYGEYRTYWIEDEPLRIDWTVEATYEVGDPVSDSGVIYIDMYSFYGPYYAPRVGETGLMAFLSSGHAWIAEPAGPEPPDPRKCAEGSVTIASEELSNTITPANWGGSGVGDAVYDGTNWDGYVCSDENFSASSNCSGSSSLVVSTPVKVDVTASALDQAGGSIPFNATLTAGSQAAVDTVLSNSLEGNLQLVYSTNYEPRALENAANIVANVGVVLPYEYTRGTPGWHGRYERVPIQTLESSTYHPFTIGRVASIAVDDFSSTGWSAGTYSGGKRTVTGGTGLTRSLTDDWYDIISDPTTWASDHAASGGDLQRASEYITARATPWNVKRRLHTSSDNCNWSNHRWLKLVAAANTATEIDLVIHYRHASISGSTVSTTDETVTVSDISIGTSATTVYIDLAYLADAEGDPLDHVSEIEFSGLDAGITYEFTSLGLASGTAGAAGVVDEGTATWGYWSGVQYADDECLIPVVDGRLCMQADAGLPVQYGVGWIVYAGAYSDTGSPRCSDRSATMAELIEDFWAQGEGFTITAVDAFPYSSQGWESPADAAWDTTGVCDWAMWLDCGWHASGGNASASVKLASGWLDNPCYAEFTAQDRYQARVCGLAWDTGTTPPWPAASQTVRVREHRDDVDATTYPVGGDGTEDGSPVSVSTPATDANGAFLLTTLKPAGFGRLEPDIDTDPETDLLWFPPIINYDVQGVTLMDSADPETPAPGSTATPANRGIAWLTISGEPTETDVSGVHFLTAANGWSYRAYPAGSQVEVQRRTRADGDWQSFALRTGTEPWLAEDGDGAVWLTWRIGTSTIRLANLMSSEEGDVATGTHPTIRWAPCWGLRIETRWRSNNVYATVSDGQGNALYGGEVLMVSSVPEQAVAVDWREDGVMEAAYSDGTNVVILTSDDNGRTWS